MLNLTERIIQLRQYRHETGSLGTPPQEIERYRDLSNWVSEMRKRAITGELTLQTIAILILRNVKPERRALSHMRSKIIKQVKLESRLKRLTQSLQPLAGQSVNVELATLLNSVTCRFIESCANDRNYGDALSLYIEKWRPLQLLIQGRYLEDMVALALANSSTPDLSQECEDISEQHKAWKTSPVSEVMRNVGRTRPTREFALYFENIGFVLLRKITHSAHQAHFQSVSGQDWVFKKFEALEFNKAFVYAAVVNNKRKCILFFINKSHLFPENLSTRHPSQMQTINL